MGEYDDLIAAAERLAPPTGEGGEAPQERGFLDRVGSGIAGLANTVASGASAVGEAVAHPIDTITNPARMSNLARGLDDMTTLGYGQKFADWARQKVGYDPSFAPTEEEMAAEGRFRDAGRIAGMFTPGAANAIARGGGQLVKLATSGVKAASAPAALAIGAARGVGGYEATAPVTAALSSDAAGRRFEAAREAATDPAGLLLSGGLGVAGGAVSRASETAPARVLERAKRDITTGEQNTGKRKTEKLAAATGPDDQKLKDLFGRDPDLYEAIATKAHASPGKALGAVDDVMVDKNAKLNDAYSKMEKADRLVTPSDIAVEFDKLVGDKLKAGDQPALAVIRRERARFLDEYGQFGKLGADTMRGLKETAGKGAFEGMPIPASIKLDIWKVYAKAIERQAKGTPGVDVDELRALNRDMSVLIPAQIALKERAVMQVADRPGMRAMIHGATNRIAGPVLGPVAGTLLGEAANHPIAGLALGVAAPIAGRAVGQGGRQLDFNLAKRFGGAAPDLSSGAGARAAELEYAARVSQGMGDGMSLADAVKAAEQ